MLHELHQESELIIGCTSKGVIDKVHSRWLDKVVDRVVG